MIEVEGVVVESLPNTTFQVDFGNGHLILEMIVLIANGGKMLINSIKMKNFKNNLILNM